MERSQQDQPDLQLLRTKRKMAGPGRWFTATGLAPLIAGLLLVFLASGWASVLGIVLIALSLPLFAVGAGLLLSSGVAGWVARRWPFA
jgi:hypothetical protein